MKWSGISELAGKVPVGKIWLSISLLFIFDQIYSWIFKQDDLSLWYSQIARTWIIEVVGRSEEYEWENRMQCLDERRSLGRMVTAEISCADGNINSCPILRALMRIVDQAPRRLEREEYSKDEEWSEAEDTQDTIKVGGLQANWRQRNKVLCNMKRGIRSKSFPLVSQAQKVAIGTFLNEVLASATLGQEIGNIRELLIGSDRWLDFFQALSSRSTDTERVQPDDFQIVQLLMTVTRCISTVPFESCAESSMVW